MTNVMDYQIYDPAITSGVIIDSYNNAAGLTFVGTASVAFYGGKYWAAVEGSTGGLSEGATENTIPGGGQRIWMVTCDGADDPTDPANWSDPFKPFTNTTYCNNPVSTPGYAADYQPCFTVVGGELWCAWLGGNSFGFLSKLSAPQGKWTNWRWMFDTANSNKPTLSSDLTSEGLQLNGFTPWPRWLDGAETVVANSSDGMVLSDETVVIPITFNSDAQSADPRVATAGSFTKHVKYNAIMYLRNGSWNVTTVPNSSAYGDFALWEPCIEEDAIGNVYLFSRCLNMSGTDDDQLLVSASYDSLESFTIPVSAKMRVSNARAMIRRVLPNVTVMIHTDSQIHSTGAVEQNNIIARKNVSLFVSRRGIPDLGPGVGISGNDLYTNYPQFMVRGNDIFAVYTVGNGGSGVRASLKIVRVTPVWDSNAAYIHPRSNVKFNSLLPFDAELEAGPPPAYRFIGVNEMISAATVSATTGVTLAAWADQLADSGVIMDARTSGGAFTPTSFGYMLQLRGLTVGALSFLHGLTLQPGPKTFLAAVVDNSTQTVKLYVAKGDSDFTVVTGYYHSILFSTTPTDGDTVTINGVVYTFRTAPSLTNDVAIGATVANSTANLALKVDPNAMQVHDLSPRMLLARDDIGTFAVTSGSSAVTVESGIPLNAGAVYVGYKAFSASTVAPWSGRIYEARVYDSALTVANLRSLYNNLADDFGYTAIAGTSTAPASPLIFLDPNNPSTTNFPSVGVAPVCEIVNSHTMTLHGEASAFFDLPFRTTRITLRYKLNAAPVGTDRYVIATFGDGDKPLRLYVDAADPGHLYANGHLVMDVANANVWQDIPIVVSAKKIAIGSFERFFTGNPRGYLGNAFPQGLLASSKSITVDSASMKAAPVL